MNLQLFRIFLWTGKSEFSKRALIAWEQVCLPKEAGGWNIILAKFWNRAAICKLLWGLANKKDKLWVKWIHAYYIKGKDMFAMDIPRQASWIIRKIIGAREYVKNCPAAGVVMNSQCFGVGKMYKALRGSFDKVPWHRMISHNGAHPKWLFITWLAIRRRLPTCDRLIRFGVVCDQVCSLCNVENESMDHLFFQCPYSTSVIQKIRQWSGVKDGRRSWEQELEFMTTQCHSKTGVQLMYRMTLAAAVYYIWMERNQRKFQQRSSKVETIVHQCEVNIAIRCQHQPKLLKLIRN